MTTKPVKTGIVGCGNISDIYFQANKKFEVLDIVACADLIPERAETQAQKYDIAKAYRTEDLLADPDIELVINLTIPQAHAAVATAAVQAGKSVYNEKPLTVSRKDGQALLTLAQQKGVRIGGAPDTFLGGGIQTCRKLIDDGQIGKPIAATAFMMCHGHESWHPAPEFYYRIGGGPMFDMGPYYLTALIALLGPVCRVSGLTQTTFAERTITSQPQHGKKVSVEVPTHVSGMLEFSAGAVASIITSFDVWSHQLPHIEVYGTEGTLIVPDPNTFGGPVRIKRAQTDEWVEVPLTHGYAENSRGLGAADMAQALRSGREHRANGNLAFHVLDIMHAIHESSVQGEHILLQSGCQQPAPFAPGMSPGVLDE